MPKNRLKWGEQEEMMATAYENIAFSLGIIYLLTTISQTKSRR